MHPPAQAQAATKELPPGLPGAREDWWYRNWVWVLVLGGGSAAALLFGGIALIVVAAFGAMRSSGACEEAVARAAASPAVMQALGAPLETGWFVTGTLDPGRSAKMAIPVAGPRGTARIDAVASKATGEWVFSTLTVRLKATGERISLLEQEPPRNPAVPLPAK